MDSFVKFAKHLRRKLCQFSMSFIKIKAEVIFPNSFYETNKEGKPQTNISHEYE